MLASWPLPAIAAATFISASWMQLAVAHPLSSHDKLPRGVILQDTGALPATGREVAPNTNNGQQAGLVVIIDPGRSGNLKALPPAPEGAQAAPVRDSPQKAGGNNTQTVSETSTTGFSDVCDGQILMNGRQQKNGERSCSPTPMGEVPSSNDMPTVSITQPSMCDNVEIGKPLEIVAKYRNIELGSFTNSTTTYNSAPARLNEQGQLIGHSHFTCQRLGADTFNPAEPPNSKDPAFFKGVEKPGKTENGTTTIQVVKEDGLSEPGCYRCCTMTAASNHQAAGMPVAARGPQDSCTFFSAGGSDCGCKKTR